MFRKVTLLLALGAVTALPLVLNACGGIDPDPTTPGTWVPPVTCNVDSDCKTGEICHPNGLVCVKTCTTATDCAAGFKCEDVGTKGKICKCGSSSNCGKVDVDGGSNTQVCNADLDDLCENRCAQDSDCDYDFYPQTRKCDKATGLCKTGTSTSCSPACAATEYCDTNTYTCVTKCTPQTCNNASYAKCSTTTFECVGCTVDADCQYVTGGTNLKCTVATGKCESATLTCNASNLAPGASGGPDTCAYGQICVSTACTASLPDGTCSDYSWNKLLEGPVIYSVSPSSSATSNSTTECGNGGAKIEVKVDFYAPNGLTYASFKDFLDPAACGAVNPNPCLGHFSFTTSTGKIASKTGASFIRGLPTSGSTFGSFTAGLCGTQTTTGRAVWIVDDGGSGGNAACL